ncbi:hypothetical protein [Kutzneria sp. NPDC051319]|uniref:hypothetical protein n=1 Tax=Kutzneria sp. NPDC051319 TaxID=3155047 RepID=UPI003418AEFA
MTATDPDPTRPIHDPPLDTIRQHLTRRVPALTDHQADAVTLWTAATWAPWACDQTPLLVITGPAKAGKTRLLNAVASLSDYPVPSERHTAAAIRTALAYWPTTLVIDDVGARILCRDSKAMQLVADHTHRARSANLFLMAALATEAEPPSELAARSLVIRLATPATPPAPGPAPGRLDLRPALWQWLIDADDKTFPPPVPADLLPAGRVGPFLPLLDVAHYAGRDWPDRVRHAMAALTGIPPATPAA